MSLQKHFKWSDKVYTMKEFVDIFTYRLPLIIFISVGWDGKDEDHTFSGDEVYRIAAVKRQRRVVAKHGSGYFVSIPTTTKKRVDILYPDGNERKSASMDDLVLALAAIGDGSLTMMFENDEKVSFSFGPDEGAEISFGQMRVVDVYDERYLVGHSICEGTVYSPVMPVPIPVYMTIELATAVGLVGGTDEDYHKALADIEEQMKDGKIEVEDNDEIMLFPHDITGSDYEYVRPCNWAPGILTEASCQMVLPEMTSSPSYPSSIGRPLTNVRKASHRRRLNKPPPPDPSATDPQVKGRPHAVVAPVPRHETPVVRQQSSDTQPPLPRRAPRMPRAASVTTPSSPLSSSLSRSTPNSSRSTGHGDEDYTLEDDDPLYNSGSAQNATRSNEYKSLRDVPADIRTLTPEQLTLCMRVLKIPEQCISAFREKNVDGYMLASVDEAILVEEFKFSRFDAIKMIKFAKSQYRP